MALVTTKTTSLKYLAEVIRTLLKDNVLIGTLLFYSRGSF